MKQQQFLPASPRSLSSPSQSVASSTASDSSAYKEAGSFDQVHSKIPNRPLPAGSSSSSSVQRKPVPSLPSPSQPEKSAADQQQQRHSIGSAPPTPPPTDPIPPIPSPTASTFSDRTRDSRIAGSTKEKEASDGQTKGLGLTGHQSLESLQQEFEKQALSDEIDALNPSRSQFQSRIFKQGKSHAKSVTSEASTDTFGTSSRKLPKEEVPPPMPTARLNSKNLEAVNSSSRPSRLASFQQKPSQFASRSEDIDLELQDSDDDDDFDGYSDDEITEQAHHAPSALPSTHLRPTPQDQKTFPSRERRSPIGNPGGFPLPPPRSESLDQEKVDLDRENGYDERKIRTNSLQKPSSPQGPSFQERIQQKQISPLPLQSNGRVVGSLSSSQFQPQSSQMLSRQPSGFGKASASSSLTEMPLRRDNFDADDDGDGNQDLDAGNRFYKRSLQRSNLGDWAPSATPAYASSGLATLPDWDTIRDGGLTSKPISQVKRDMDWSLKRLISPQVFEKLLADPLGRHRFREFLVRAEGTEAKLDMLFDLTQYSKSISAIKTTAEALHDVYLVEDSPAHQEIPPQIDQQVFGSLKKTFDLKVSLEDAQSHLLQSLFQNEFQRFIKNQIIETTKVRLGESIDPNNSDGLGNAFCLSNPRLRDNPLVLVSNQFSSITGYSREEILGRSCRFLQGPSTNPASVQRVRDALNKAESITELLLNYRKDGTPFWCLLNIIPLKDASGQVAYFIGSQTNVTGTLANSKSLSFLISSNQNTKVDLEMANHNGIEVSATMARHLGISHAAGTTSIETSSIISGASGGRKSERYRNRAAGAYNPDHDPMPMLDPQLTGAGKKNGFFKMFGGKSNSLSPSNAIKKQALNGGGNQAMSQRLEGAELKDIRSREAATLDEQMDFFTQQSSKLLILRRQKREVLFATGELISFFDLPTENATQLLSSPLVHADFLSLICGADKNETKALRAKVGHSISRGEALNIEVGIRKPPKNRFGSSNSSSGKIVKFTTLFLTPLKDRENSSYALVALFA